MYLLGIEVPGNIEKEIIQVTTRIFQKRGFVSSVAFPPIIPVAFLSDMPEKKDMENGRYVTKAEFSTTEAVREGDIVFLEVQPKSTWEEIRTYFESYATSGLFYTFSGFFLGQREPEKELASIPGEIPEDFKLHWKGGALIVLSIEVTEPGLWWEEIFYESVSHDKLKTRPGRQ